MKNYFSIAVFTFVTSVCQAQFWRISEPVQLDGTVNTIEAEESIPVFILCEPSTRRIRVENTIKIFGIAPEIQMVLTLIAND